MAENRVKMKILTARGKWQDVAVLLDQFNTFIIKMMLKLSVRLEEMHLLITLEEFSKDLLAVGSFSQQSNMLMYADVC